MKGVNTMNGDVDEKKPQFRVIVIMDETLKKEIEEASDLLHISMSAFIRMTMARVAKEVIDEVGSLEPEED